MLLVRLGKDASSITTVNSLTAGLLPGGHSEKSLDRSPRKGQLLAAKVTRERNAAECLWGHEASTAAPWAANSIKVGKLSCGEHVCGPEKKIRVGGGASCGSHFVTHFLRNRPTRAIFLTQISFLEPAPLEILSLFNVISPFSATFFQVTLKLNVRLGRVLQGSLPSPHWVPLLTPHVTIIMYLLCVIYIFIFVSLLLNHESLKGSKVTFILVSLKKSVL